LVPVEEAAIDKATTRSSARGRARAESEERQRRRDDSPESSVSSFSHTDKDQHQQQRGDQTSEAAKSPPEEVETVTLHEEAANETTVEQRKEELGRNPGEKAFFKLLHAELKKATHFFDKAQQEFVIREERVREGMLIMQQPNSIMVSEKWSMLAKSIYRLYKDLLLLETFAIMTYCSFSKILKKVRFTLPKKLCPL
jgi:hypothetical protein